MNPLFFLLVAQAGQPPADTSALIGRGGWAAIVGVLCGVVLYLARRIEKLQEQLVAAAASAKAEVVELQRTHAKELTAMMAARLEDQDAVITAVRVLDGVADRVGGNTPPPPRRPSRPTGA